MTTAFDEATRVEPLGERRYRAGIDASWSGGAGPSGGYLAAVVLRALGDEVADGARLPRSLQCQFERPAQPGEAEVRVVHERRGRRVSFFAATLAQGGRVCVSSSAVFALAGDRSLDYCDLRAPEVPPAERCPSVHADGSEPPILGQLDLRQAFGAGPARTAESIGGGWLRLRDPRRTDALTLCCYADAWLPSPTGRLGFMPLAPTLVYSVYFREPAPAEDADAHVLLQVTSRCAYDGYFEEDALVWSRSGTLLAQARQFAILA